MLENLAKLCCYKIADDLGSFQAFVSSKCLAFTSGPGYNMISGTVRQAC